MADKPVLLESITQETCPIASSSTGLGEWKGPHIQSCNKVSTHSSNTFTT